MSSFHKQLLSCLIGFIVTQAVKAESDDEVQPYKSWWIAHGILLALAWGVCAPLAIGASILRNPLQDRFGQSWYQIHFYLNLLALLLTTIGLVIAIVLMGLENESHFVENLHTRVGLVVMVFMVVQVLAGYFRPPAANAKALSQNGEGTLKSDDESGGKEKQVAASGADQATTTVSRPKVRLAWEWFHRVAGLVLLGLAWYNVHSGIEYQLRKWEDTKDWSSMFWGITGAISGLIFLAKIAPCK